MNSPDWQKEFPGAVIVCDAQGVILYANDKACRTYEKYGGKEIAGKNVLDCHPEPARTKLKKMLGTREKNCYTIEKQGVKKLIYQSPWYENGEYKGFVELSLEIPFEMPHFVRQSR